MNKMTTINYESTPGCSEENAYKPPEYRVSLETNDKRIAVETLNELRKLVEAYDNEPQGESDNAF